MGEYLDIFIAFLKIGAFSFGGGYAMIPMIRQEVLINNSWMTELELVDIIAVSQMTPGPIAINLATYLGFKIHGVLGSLVATIAVTLPSFVVMTIFYLMVKKLAGNKYMGWFFTGLKPVVVGLILAGLLSVIGTSIIDIGTTIILLVSFYLAHIRKWHPIKVIGVSALIGLLAYGI